MIGPSLLTIPESESEVQGAEEVVITLAQVWLTMGVQRLYTLTYAILHRKCTPCKQLDVFHCNY